MYDTRSIKALRRVSLTINLWRIAWLKARKKAIESPKSRRKKRSKQSLQRRAKRGLRRVGSRPLDQARRNRSESRQQCENPGRLRPHERPLHPAAPARASYRFQVASHETRALSLMSALRVNSGTRLRKKTAEKAISVFGFGLRSRRSLLLQWIGEIDLREMHHHCDENRTNKVPF